LNELLQTSPNKIAFSSRRIKAKIALSVWQNLSAFNCNNFHPRKKRTLNSIVNHKFAVMDKPQTFIQHQQRFQSRGKKGLERQIRIND
jgi:hypothetical protein